MSVNSDPLNSLVKHFRSICNKHINIKNKIKNKRNIIIRIKQLQNNKLKHTNVNQMRKRCHQDAKNSGSGI